jgi:hypothetical protein
VRTRELAAKIAQVNAHYVSDAKFISDRDSVLADNIRAGKLTIQEALRQLGRVTQRDRKPRAQSPGDFLVRGCA